MKGREGKGAPTDLLVCFPSRSYLALMPKPICSPSRPTEPTKRSNHHRHQITRFNNRGGQANSLLWAKTKSMASEISEPSSPKVTCAGQIKIKPKLRSSKNWQSVMEEIERLQNNRKLKKRPTWVEALGIKKDMMQFLTCLRSLRLHLRCFGSFHESDITSDDDDEEEQEAQENHVSLEDSDDSNASRTMFSKWSMVLQKYQNNGSSTERYEKEELQDRDGPCDEGSDAAPSVPPSNAMLLMRCRSAPARSWLEEREQEEEEENKAKLALEEEKKEESLVLMSYAPDFFEVSSDIVKETWIVGGMTDPLSRSRSWKR